MQTSLRFGVATADHQCEAYDGHDDIRDVWERAQRLTPRGRATDFWNRYREDVDLAKGLGCTAFRLSLSWARLEPQPGVWDDAVFAHYRDVLQYMRNAGMVTIVTLHHNTWPLHVEAAGDGAGMLDALFPQRMRLYARHVAARLGDLIDYYVTINEPNQLVYGYIKGFWMSGYPMPPGRDPLATGEEEMNAVLRLIPNLFRAHAAAREEVKNLHPDAKLGTNPLVLGLPRWLQNLADRNATRVKSPEQVVRQARRLRQHQVVDRGGVDVSIAQLTITHHRMEYALFSRPYLTTHLAILHRVSEPVPKDLATWKARIGVVEGLPPASRAPGLFPDAAFSYYAHIGDALEALSARQIDAVFDQEAMIRQDATGELTLQVLDGDEQRYGVALALGSQTLLALVNAAILNDKRHDPSREPDASVERIRKRGKLRVGIHPGIQGLCMPDGKGGYDGTEPDIARRIARELFGTDQGKVEFVVLAGTQRLAATRSPLRLFDSVRKSIGMFTTLIGTNWWNLGMAGELPEFLCPGECVGTLDYVGLDYYWGVPGIWPAQLKRLSAAAECRYGMAPVWPGVLRAILKEAHKRFPGKPIIVVENGCVTSADGFTRAKYLDAHLSEVLQAHDEGIPIDAYLCWSITSNREWGLTFDDNSDFGLYHIDLDRDPDLKRVPTDAAARYAQIIQGNKGK
ncbi:MAG TPA: family 1 glycosylhydrolase [Candidatus Baltobacteraceae bacterium]|nr:family 1 glycosylhydrolase [Candidatus Baltobacteraceae bacterium]